jgi:hypothetical protein
MGRVFQAIDTETGRAVAVKILLASDDNLDALLRFQQEGAVLSTLRHPNIVEVYGALLDGEQHTSSIIMELLEGRSLGRILQAEHLALERVSHIAQQVASALAYAHSRGIIHRDVKPDNIMIVGNDHVKVTDFGIARILGTGATLNTATGMSIGTPLYMSPEQIEGRRVDGRTDIYSLGAVLYQMVTGRPPFEGSDPLTVAFKHVHKDPQHPSEIAADVPPEWEEIILKALAKDPSDRYQSAAAMGEAIAALGAGEPVAEPDGREEDGAPSGQTESTTHVAVPTATIIPSTPEPSTIVSSAQSDAGHASASAAIVDTGPERTQKARDRRGLPRWWPAAGGALILVVVAGIIVVLALHGNTSSSGGAAPTAAPGGVALTQVNQWGSAGSGTGEFRSPASVAVDAHGNVVVADTGNNRIQALASSTDPIGSWGSAGAELGEFDHPMAVALDRRGNIYVADTNNNRIQKLSATGQLLAAWGSQGSGSGDFDHPAGIAVDGSGNIYVADTGNNRIQKLSSSGAPVATWGSQGSDPGQFDHPTAIAVDANGDLFIADTGNNRIQELASTSDPLGQWGKKGSGRLEFNGPRGVAVDASGDIYVADTGNNRIQELSPAGQSIFTAGGAGSGPGELRAPGSILVDGHGHLYVADTGNDRIQELSVRR